MGYGDLLFNNNDIAFGTDDGDVVDVTDHIDTGVVLRFHGWLLDGIVLCVVDVVAFGSNVGVNNGSALVVPHGTENGWLQGTALGSDDGNRNGILLGTDVISHSLSTEDSALLSGTVGVNDGDKHGYDDGNALGSVTGIYCYDLLLHELMMDPQMVLHLDLQKVHYLIPMKESMMVLYLVYCLALMMDKKMIRY